MLTYTGDRKNHYNRKHGSNIRNLQSNWNETTKNYDHKTSKHNNLFLSTKTKTNQVKHFIYNPLINMMDFVGEYDKTRSSKYENLVPRDGRTYPRWPCYAVKKYLQQWIQPWMLNALFNVVTLVNQEEIILRLLNIKFSWYTNMNLNWIVKPVLTWTMFAKIPILNIFPSPIKGANTGMRSSCHKVRLKSKRCQLSTKKKLEKISNMNRRSAKIELTRNLRYSPCNSSNQHQVSVLVFVKVKLCF